MVINRNVYHFVFSVGQSVWFSTPDDHEFKRFWLQTKDRDILVFKARAQNNASVALCPSDQSSTCHEVIIGISNNSTALRYGFSGLPSTITYTPELLSSSTFRTFWIRWSNSSIDVGKGPDVGLNAFLNGSFTVPHSVSAVGFASGLDSSGQWEIINTDGMLKIANQFILLSFPNISFASIMKY